MKQAPASTSVKLNANISAAECSVTPNAYAGRMAHEAYGDIFGLREHTGDDLGLHGRQVH